MPSHPAVELVEAALRDAGIEPQTRWLDESAPTAIAAAEALGVDVGAIANSLVFTLDGAPLLVMTSGSHRVDTAWLGEQLGGSIKRADAELVKRATGQTIGGVLSDNRRSTASSALASRNRDAIAIAPARTPTRCSR